MPRDRYAALTPPDGTLPAARGRLYASVLDVVGGTPVVLLPRIAAAEGLAARIALKLEYLNPLGSVKDRIGRAMVDQAERDGLIALQFITYPDARDDQLRRGVDFIQSFQV